MSCNDNISFEEEYLYLIYNIIEAHKNGDSFYENVYRKSYEDICKSLALKYMKSKGFCEMPNFDLIESYEYDYSLAEYISKRELIQYDTEELKKKYEEVWDLREGMYTVSSKNLTQMDLAYHSDDAPCGAVASENFRNNFGQVPFRAACHQ